MFLWSIHVFVITRCVYDPFCTVIIYVPLYLQYLFGTLLLQQHTAMALTWYYHVQKHGNIIEQFCL